MAVTKEISVTVARTIGMPNYSSVRYEDSGTVMLEPGDSPNQVYAETYARDDARLQSKTAHHGV